MAFRAANDASALYNTFKTHIFGSCLRFRASAKRFVHGGASSRSGKAKTEKAVKAFVIFGRRSFIPCE
jgi:hypothetical protein